jgi:hypothetical protein
MTMTLPAIIPSTDDVLAAMLTENTGRHMLDSGGAYGRNFERNAGATVEALMERPEVIPSTWERDGATVVEYVTLDVFHFLRQRVEYLPELDAEFHEFAMADEREREPWFACLEEWLTEVGATGGHMGQHPMTVNTYNGEDCLSQVLQYTVFWLPEREEEGPFIALTIHGGCDVRGGYTAPRMFDCYGEEYALMDNADLEVYMSEPEDVVPDPAVEPPLPMDVPARYPRSVSISIRGGYGDRYSDDDVPEEYDFKFGETPVTADGDGFIVADGPAKGWSVAFCPPYAS